MKQLFGAFCVVAIFVGATPADAATIFGDFDWRTRPEGDFMTPIRDQSPCGSCWAFGAVAALEAKFAINAGDPDLNLDLSEQHLLCDGRSGGCGGGWEFLATLFFMVEGVTDEATLPYTASETSPNWPLNTPYKDYKTDAVDIFIGNDDDFGIGYPHNFSRELVKATLEAEGPLPCAIHSSEFFAPTGSPAGEFDFSVPVGYDIAGVGALPDAPLGDINHCVTIVGYKDDPSMTEGGYYIVKNSWGTAWGDDGYGFVKYTDLEQYRRVHAITGNTFVDEILPPPPIPEPSAFVVWSLMGGLAMGVFSWRRRAH